MKPRITGSCRVIITITQLIVIAALFVLSFSPDCLSAGTKLNQPAVKADKTGKSLLTPSGKDAVSARTDPVLKPDADAANKCFWKGDYEKAGLYCRKLLELENCPDDRLSENYCRLLVNAGTCHLHLDELDDARNLLEKAWRNIEGTKREDTLLGADCLNAMAELNYKQAKYDKALSQYQAALAVFNRLFGKTSPENLATLEGIAGCYYRQNTYPEALEAFHRVAQIDLDLHGAKHQRFAKTLANLAETYQKIKEYDKASDLFAHSTAIFRKQASEQMLQEIKNQSDSRQLTTAEAGAAVERVFEFVSAADVVDALNKRTLEILGKNETANKNLRYKIRPKNFSSWRVKRADKSSDVGFWDICPTVEQKGLIVCVHGLGLHHESYLTFAEMVTPKGYGVLAFDMIGFGSSMAEKGLDELDLDESVEGVRAILASIRRQTPDLPVFLLGESMGGALALHLTAKYSDLVDGLISSVPSGKRFRSKRTMVKVGLKLIEGKEKAFDIGSQVIEQATEQEDLRQKLQDDSETRLELTPAELLRFQAFMNQNINHAQQIEDTPVLVLQGYKDRLVKPEGTVEIFKAIANPEKDLLIVGNSEHLILEEGQCSQEVVNMLTAWLDAHLPHLKDSEAEKKAQAQSKHP